MTPDSPADTPPEETVDTGGTTTPATTCADGTPVELFTPGSAMDFDLPVPDLTLPTAEGDWILSEQWSGCDTYVFVLYDPQVTYSQQLIDGNLREWLEASPENVHYFFATHRRGDNGTEDLAYVAEELENGLDRLDDDGAYWAPRLHLVEGGASAVEVLGDFVDVYDNEGNGLWAFGIDRFGVAREVGYLADPATGWAEAEPVWLAYEPKLWNFEAAREMRLDAQGATVVTVFDHVEVSDGSWSGATAAAEIEVPANVGDFDSLEVDLRLDCTGHPEADHCPAWDYLVYAYVCDPDDPATTDVDESTTCTELGRFITTYWRPGRWVVDASGFLPLFQTGGTRVIRFYTTQLYDVTLSLRFFDAGKAAVPFAMEPLWTGGAFDETYNDAHPPIAFTPPQGTTKVEVMAIVSGHGYGDDRENCAEFCNHQHEFVANAGQAHLLEFPEAGSTYGCAEQVATKGTIPNQSGTWVYGRGGWCPGLEVPPWYADVTADVDLAGENELAYRGLFEGGTYVPEDRPDESRTWFAARVDVQSWLVYSR